ncbi:MAG TPA: hypothetical protein VF930_05840 [Stellaceae bacterium]
MPNIPTFTAGEIMGSVAPVPVPHIDPEQAGRVADAIARGGHDVEEVGKTWLERSAESQRGVMAKDAMVGGQAGLEEAHQRLAKLAGTTDANGNIVTALQARNSFNDEAARIREKTLAPIADPFVRAKVAQDFDEAQIRHAHELVEYQATPREAAAQAGKLTLDLKGLGDQYATAATPEGRDQVMRSAMTAINTTRDAGFISGETAAQHQVRFASDAQDATARRDINAVRDLGSRDPDAALALARRISDPANYQGMLPETREKRAAAAENLAYTVTVQAAMRQQKSDAAEDRALRKDQQANEIDWLDRVYQFQAGKGPAPDLTALSDAARRGDLSTPGFAAVHAALDRAEQGRDNPLVKNDLLRRIGEGEDVHGDIRQAIVDHQLSDASQSELMRANMARQGKGDNAVARAAFQQLKTALGGHAIDSGFLDLTREGVKDQAALWAQAQGEWNKRVLVGNEDPNAVYADMVPRYRHATLSQQSMPNPRLGAVQSVDDVAAVWARTKDALAAGRITQDQYNDEAQLLDRYRRFYADEAARLAAAPPRPGAGGKLRPGAEP